MPLLRYGQTHIRGQSQLGCISVAEKDKLRDVEVARYIWHPAVANTQLRKYNAKAVTFWYEDHEGKRHFVTINVQKFIRALI